jgi:phosphatidylethanolamine/phosphatidyl-N-methylethanolamine N-methyltransferase
MRDSLTFLMQSLLRFRQMGAIVPSSPRLARAMVREIPPLHADELLVELGPGTGVFTRELVARFPRNRVVAVEFNPELAERLQRQMPMVAVVTGCASRIGDHLDGLDLPRNRVAAVVSGLPLLSLPRELGDSIFSSLAEVLVPGRRYIQFTYSKRAWRRHHPPGFRLDTTRRVWLNVPPAEVLPFTRLEQHDFAAVPA